MKTREGTNPSARGAHTYTYKGPVKDRQKVDPGQAARCEKGVKDASYCPKNDVHFGHNLSKLAI
jgi:hypothetical protein